MTDRVIVAEDSFHISMIISGTHASMGSSSAFGGNGLLDEKMFHKMVFFVLQKRFSKRLIIIERSLLYISQ